MNVKEGIKQLKRSKDSISRIQFDIELCLRQLADENTHFLKLAGELGVLDPDEQRYSNKYLPLDTSLMTQLIERAEFLALDVPKNETDFKLQDNAYEQ